MLLLFSARDELLQYGRAHFRPHSSETSSLLMLLFRVYQEDKSMSAQLKERIRQMMDEFMRSLPDEERLKLIQSAPAEERLKGLSIEEMLQALSPEKREAMAQQLKSNGAS